GRQAPQARGRRRREPQVQRQPRDPAGAVRRQHRRRRGMGAGRSHRHRGARPAERRRRSGEGLMSWHDFASWVVGIWGSDPSVLQYLIRTVIYIALIMLPLIISVAFLSLAERSVIG